jgi:hypothetical protein
MRGPGPRFELGRKAPQASMLPSYITPATVRFLAAPLISRVLIHFRCSAILTCLFRFSYLLVSFFCLRLFGGIQSQEDVKVFLLGFFAGAINLIID